MEDEGRLSFRLHKRRIEVYRPVAMWEIKVLGKKKKITVEVVKHWKRLSRCYVVSIHGDDDSAK